MVVGAERASGLNEKRRGLHHPFRLAAAGEIDVALVEFRDRQARFGFGDILEAFQAHGGRVEVLDGPVAVDVAQELVADRLAVVTWFAAHRYGSRSQEFRRKVKEAAREAEGLAGGMEREQFLWSTAADSHMVNTTTSSAPWRR